MTNIYFVRHAQSCSNIYKNLGEDYQPPLSYFGIQQAIYLGIDNEIIDKDFEEYYCSPSLRTIMTAYLALRDKTKKITLKLNSNLIEKLHHPKNYQNAIVKKINLQEMINYIKLWFQTKYFDNFIDYKFIDLIYNLVLLLNYHKKLEKYKNILQSLFNNNDKTKTRTEFLTILIDLLKKNEDLNLNSKPIYIYQTNLLYLIYSYLQIKIINDNKYDIILFLNDNKFEIFIDNNSPKENKLYDIINSLEKFLNKNYYFNNNIEIEYNYDEKHPDTNDKIQNFIDSINNDNNNILCFSHGVTLTTYFKYIKHLNNTEIVHYNTLTKQNNRIKRDMLNKNLKEYTTDTICKEPEGNGMFYIIDKIFNNNKYNVNNDKQVLDLYKTHIDQNLLQVGGKYDKKYLKYKKKYMKLQKIKLNN